MGLFDFLEAEEETEIVLQKKQSKKSQKRVFAFVETEVEEEKTETATADDGTEYIDFGPEITEDGEPLASAEPEKVKHEDFGQKIGGARKDLWVKRGLSVADMAEMNDAEKEKYAVKNSVWPAIDYKALVENGLSRINAMRLKLIRDELPCRALASQREKYVEVMGEIRDYFSKKTSDEDFVNITEMPFELGLWQKRGESSWSFDSTDKAYQSGILYYDRSKFYNVLHKTDDAVTKEIVKKKFLWTAQDEALYNACLFQMNKESFVIMDRYISIKGKGGSARVTNPFGEGKPLKEVDFSVLHQDKWNVVTYVDRYTTRIEVYNCDTYDELVKAYVSKFEKEHEGETFGKVVASRKAGFVPPQLENIKREGGEDYREGKDATADDFLNELKFRGGEYGNWVNEEERRQNLNMCYDAIRDFENALNLPVGTVARGKLSIAFGARGKSKALAHYEPMRQVINLTKMRGAGSLAHELFHYLDNLLYSIEYGRDADKFLTENGRGNELYELLKSFKYKDDTTEEWRAERKQSFKEAFERNIASFRKYVEYCIPDSGIDLEGKKVRRELCEALVDKASKSKYHLCGVFNHRKYDYHPEEIDKLSELHKKYYGKKLANSLIDRLAWRLNDISESYGSYCDMDTAKREVKTDFFTTAEKLDNSYNKDSKGYWASDVELFARAGAAYIKDKLAAKGIRNDYLCGHADVSAGLCGYVSPQGKERELINAKFDALFNKYFNEKGLA